MRDAHTGAFCSISEYVQNFVIKNKHPEFVKQIHVHYIRMLEEYGISDSPYTAQSLIAKILDTFGEELVLCKSSKKGSNVLYHKSK